MILQIWQYNDTINVICFIGLNIFYIFATFLLSQVYIEQNRATVLIKYLDRKEKTMKKLVAITMCVMTLSLTACGNTTSAKENPQNQTKSEVSTEEAVQIPNPFVDCKTVEEAETIAGFKAAVPEKMPDGYTQETIRAVEHDLIELIYENGKKSIRIRKGKGSGDIGGDYNSYKENNTVTIGKFQVSIKGNDGKVSVAVWEDGEYSFAVSADPAEGGLRSSEISDIISSIQ